MIMKITYFCVPSDPYRCQWGCLVNTIYHEFILTTLLIILSLFDDSLSLYTTYVFLSRIFVTVSLS